MKTTAFIALIASGLACAGLSFAQEASETATVRFAHLSPNVSVLEFELVPAEGEPLTLSDVAFEGVTAYVKVDGGSHVARALDGERVVFEETLDLVPDTDHTVALVGLALPDQNAESEEDEGFLDFVQDLLGGGEEDTLALRFLTFEERDSFPFDEGERLVRVVHASPGTDAVDLTAAGNDGREVVIEGVAFGSVSSYDPIISGFQEPGLSLSGSENMMIDLSSLSFEPGTFNTLVLTGTPLEQAPLKVQLLKETGQPAENPMGD